MRKVLEIGDYEIELMETDLVPVTKSIYDVENPEARKSSFTKTIKLPSSRVNNQVFIAYFDIANYIENDTQFNPFYNPTKKVKAVYYEDSLEVITGYAQLTDIVKTKEEIIYELVIFGENADFFKSIDGKNLSDLDLSDYDHNYTRANIIASWTGTLGEGYYYPQVKNGKQIDVLINGGWIKDYWKVNDFDCWIYVKTIWDKIWEQAGFNYVSNFIDSAKFKRLVFKGDENGMTRLSTEIEDSLIDYELASVALVPHLSLRSGLNYYTNFPMIFDVLNFDFLGQYNTTTGDINVDRTGDYDLTFICSPVVQNNTGSTIAGNSGDILKAVVHLIDDLGNFIQTLSFNRPITSNLTNGASLSFGASSTKVNVRLDSARTYRWCYASIRSGISVAVNSANFKIYLNAKYDTNDVVTINSLLNKEINQKDFVLGLVKMFNLYIEPYYYNPTDSASGCYLTYLIEPRDDYYTEEVIDWTKKIDYNKEFTIKPLGAAKDKFTNFTYLEDKDYYNQLYNQMTGRIYGDFKAVVQNEFLSTTKEVKIPFSLMVWAINNKRDANQTRPLPFDVKSLEADGVRNDKSKPKIMYKNDVVGCDDWAFGDDAKGTNITIYQTYSTVSTFDDARSPNIDLCFDNPEKVFYQFEDGTIQVSNTGLFNQFYYRQFYELNDKNSKVLECYVNLTPLDVHNLSLRPIYEIDGSHWQLYEMIDYNGNETTKCRFLKLSNTDAITLANKRTLGGRSGDPRFNVDPDKFIEKNFEDGYTGGDLVTGKNNLTTGINFSPIVTDNVNTVVFSVLEVTDDIFINGDEGSPLYINVTPSIADIELTLPINEINIGKTYVVKNDKATYDVLVYKNDATLVDTIPPTETREYMILESTILIVR